MTAPISYKPNVPSGPKDTIGGSQVDFLNNFMQLYDAFAANHVPLDAASHAGNHTVVQFPEQTAAFQTDVGEISIYSRDASGQTSELFLKYQGSQAEFQFTNYQIYGITPSPTNVPFFTFLPGRILVYFGTLITPPLSIIADAPFDLFPAIAKNIITMNFCPIGTVPNYAPTVTLAPPSDDSGIYKTINLRASDIVAVQPTQFYYMVMANV